MEADSSWKSHVRIWLMALCPRKPSLPEKCRSKCEKCPPTQSFPGSGGGAVGKWEVAAWPRVLFVDKHLTCRWDSHQCVLHTPSACVLSTHRSLFVYLISYTLVGNVLFTGNRAWSSSRSWTGRVKKGSVTLPWETNSLPCMRTACVAAKTNTAAPSVLALLGLKVHTITFQLK